MNLIKKISFDKKPIICINKKTIITTFLFTDGCKTNNGGCDQFCFPYDDGTIKCACGLGYTSNGASCTGRIIYNNINYIKICTKSYYILP